MNHIIAQEYTVLQCNVTNNNAVDWRKRYDEAEAEINPMRNRLRIEINTRNCLVSMSAISSNHVFLASEVNISVLERQGIWLKQRTIE